MQSAHTKIKAVGLLSGGLDSTLAAKLRNIPLLKMGRHYFYMKQ
jgi:NH3-dependent NAD+ synthetase